MQTCKQFFPLPTHVSAHALLGSAHFLSLVSPSKTHTLKVMSKKMFSRVFSPGPGTRPMVKLGIFEIQLFLFEMRFVVGFLYAATLFSPFTHFVFFCLRQDYVDISQASQARMARGGWALLRKILWEKKKKRGTWRARL